MGNSESSGVGGLDMCCGNRPGGPSATTDPAFLRTAAAVPKVLEQFLEARRVGNIEGASACCTDDMTMRGPMGEFSGLVVVRTKAFGKPSQPLGRTLMLLQYQPQLSSAAEAVYAREFEAMIGYAQVPLRQEVGQGGDTKPRPAASPSGQSNQSYSQTVHPTSHPMSILTQICAFPLAHQFTVRNAGTDNARVCLVSFFKLNP